MVILSPFNPLTMKAQQVAAAFNDLLKGKVVEDPVRIVKLGPIPPFSPAHFLTTG